MTPDAQGRRQASRQLANGTLLITIGLVVSGLGTLGMIAVAARALPTHEYAAFAVWWTVATCSLFGVFEAYLTRLVITDSAPAGRTRGRRAPHCSPDASSSRGCCSRR